MVDIRQLVNKNKELIIKTRRGLHRIPEVGYTEEKTSAYVADYLKREGLDVQTGIAQFGVVGLLETGKPGPTLMIRADMVPCRICALMPWKWAPRWLTPYNASPAVTWIHWSPPWSPWLAFMPVTLSILSPGRLKSVVPPERLTSKSGIPGSSALKKSLAASVNPWELILN